VPADRARPPLTAVRLILSAFIVAWLCVVPDVQFARGNVSRAAAALQQASAPERTALVPSVSAERLLAAVQQRRSIVFVDAREPAEYREEHIPGAVNLPLRAIPGAAIAAYAGADMVIPYCLKDFRGFEVARALHDQGVTNVHLLSRPGINGWKAMGLPTAGEVPGRTDDEAQARLDECARTRECLKER
jgi:rhodanese-related sulfurtransferase